MLKRISHLIFITLLSTLLFACGGGGGDEGGNGTAPPGELTLAFSSVKTFRFSWVDVGDATYYQLLENPDGASGFTQVGSDIPQGTQTFDHIVPLYARINAQYILQSCNATGCTSSGTVSVSGNLVASIGYAKASNTGASDWFGITVSLAADGNTLAVGAISEDSNATGIDGDGANNGASGAGAVYVFTRSGSSWSQQAYIKASNTDVNDWFGRSVSLAADGNTLAVGAISEASNATGIGGNGANNGAAEAGAVYVFTRSGSSWSQQAYIKASNTDAGDWFGRSVSLAADGNTLAVGAIGDSNATGIDGNGANNGASDAGAVYVFTRSGSSWFQQAYVKASNTGTGDQFGSSVSLAADGNTLAVGAGGEDSNATGVNGDQTNNSASSSGAVYLY